MNENQRHNIDETFRNQIEKMSLKAPIANLDEVRANVLQRTLQSYQFQNRWLKGSLAAMILLLGGCIYFLMNKPDDTDKILTQEKIVKVYQTDTVYITKYHTKIIKIPVPFYPKVVQNHNQYANNIQPNSVTDDNTFTNGLPNENVIATNENNKVNKIPKYINLSRVKYKGLSDNQDISSISNIIHDSISTRRDDGNSISVKTINILNENFENSGEKHKEQLLSYDYLKPKPYHSEIAWKFPLLKYKSPVKLTIKPPKIKIPFMDRLSLGGYFSPENNTLDIRNDAIQAFGLGDEVISSSSNMGLRLGFKINPKISILTGLEIQTMNFNHTGNNKEEIIAENGTDGKPIFLRFTVFGVAQLPTMGMTANPQVGSSVFVEGENGHFAQAIRVPVFLKYQFYERTLRNFGWRGAGLNLYAIGGGYYAIPIKQQLTLEVYEPNGKDYYTTLTSFKNINNYSGLNLGFGAELNYGKHIQLYVEPYYQTTLKSLVNNMPIRTYVNGIGMKFGVNYQFSKK